MVFTLPTFLMSYTNYSTRVQEKESLQKELSSLNDESSAQNAKETSLLIDTIQTFNQDKSYIYVIDQILQSKPVGVSVKNFIFTPDTENKLVVDIAGVANTRKDLVSFSDSLKANSFFDSAIIPLSNFAKDKNITFTVKMTISTTTTVTTTTNQ